MKNIIVIGAGILGASTAYHLVKSGAKVTLIDRADKGQATDAAAGIVCPWLSQRRNKTWYSLVKGGARYYPELIAQLEGDGEVETGYKRVGAISLHQDFNKLKQMEERARKRKNEAPEIGEIAILSPSETKKLFPPLSGKFGSVFVSGGARVDGRALRNALINAAIKHGLTFLKGDAAIVKEGSYVSGIKLEENILLAEQVVDTTGVWSKEFQQPLGIDFLVKPQKAQISHLQLPEMDTGSWPVVMPPGTLYLLSFENGRIVAGSTHENEAGFDTRVTAGGMNEILNNALEVAPGLSNAAFLETRVGFRPFTPGFLPVFGEMPHIKGLYAANGLGASGLTSGPYVGAELAKLVLGNPTEIDPVSYSLAGAIYTT